MAESEFYALVMSLKDPGSPKIVQAKEMYILTPDFQAVKMNPKNTTDFSRSKEYGRIVIIEGTRTMVRHNIFALSDNIASLRKIFQEKKKRFVPPKRQSIGPLAEPADRYTFPDTKKEVKAVKNAEKKKATEAKKTEGDRVLKLFNRESLQAVEAPAKEINFNLGDISMIKRVTPVMTSTPFKCDALRRNGADTDVVHQTEKMKKAQAAQATLSQGDRVMKLFKKQGSQQNVQTPLEVSGNLSETEFGNVTPLTTSTAPHNHGTTETQVFKLCNDHSHVNLVEDLCKANGEVLKLKEELESLKDLSQLKSDISEIKELLRGAEGGKNNKVPKSCMLSKMGNIVSSDDEEVPEGKIKVDEDKYVLKQDVIKIDKKVTYPTTRIEKLCDIFFNDKPGHYSLTGWAANGRAVIKISDNEIKSMLKILKSMTWSHNVDITEKILRNRISKYTSEARNEDSQKNVANKLNVAAKRPNHMKPSNSKVKRSRPAEPEQAELIDMDVTDIGGNTSIHL